MPPTEPLLPRTLVAKLADVMAVVHRIPKRGRNNFHGYDYATEADIVDVVRLELAKRVIMLIPQIDDVRREPLGDKGYVLTIVDMTFTLRDGDGAGEEMSRTWQGTGLDNGDKGLYKAITGAEKYFLLKLLLIPTGDDPERERSEIASSRPTSPQSPDPPQLHHDDHSEAGMSPSGPNGGASGRSILTLVQCEPGEHGAARVLHFSDGTQTLLFTKFADIIERADQLAGSGRAIEVSWKRSESGNRYAQNIKPAQTPNLSADDDIAF